MRCKRAHCINSLLNSSNISPTDRQKNVARLEAGSLCGATRNQPDDTDPALSFNDSCSRRSSVKSSQLRSQQTHLARPLAREDIVQATR